jgi:hypothetical protein
MYKGKQTVYLDLTTGLKARISEKYGAVVAATLSEGGMTGG